MKGACVLEPLKVRRVDGHKVPYVKCRAWGHQWDEGQSSRVRPISGFHDVGRCARCTSERVFWRGWDGKPIARWYEYPDDYSDVTSMTRAEAALWLYNHSRAGKVENVA